MKSLLLRLSLPLSALLAACGSSVVVHVPPPAPPPPPVYWEGEPNDTAWLATWFGSIYPGEALYVQGFSTDDGSDLQDGLAFSAAAACRIDFSLYVDDPWTDLDVWVYDPYLAAFVGAFTVPYGTEKGTFWVDAPGEFQLVVVPSWGASHWTLVVEATNTYYGASLSAQGLPELPESLVEYAAAQIPELAARDSFNGV